MQPRSKLWFGLGTAAVCGLVAFTAARGGAQAPRTEVRVLSTPNGGILPQAITAADGTLHLVYLTGTPGNSDVYYVRRAPGSAAFSAPIRVNSQPGSAIATGTIRGAQIALGKGGAVHVAWNGSTTAEPRGPKNPDMPADSPYNGTPLCYTRLTPGATAFQPQRNLMTRTWGLDGGASITADEAGHVFVMWHATDGRSGKGEEGRRLWIARSTDNGAAFTPESTASPEPTGACACCNVRALADGAGGVFALYRGCMEHTHRDMFLVRSSDGSSGWKSRHLQPWEINACPMSSESMVRTPKQIIGAWETSGQVYYARFDLKTGAPGEMIPAPGATRNRKHPSLAVNSRGEVLLGWAEGTGWQKGGALAWQLFDAQDRPTGVSGRLEGGIPVWSLPSAVTRPDGTFELIH